jgi:DNA-binding NarL/FixJ family response regulator
MQRDHKIPVSVCSSIKVSKNEGLLSLALTEREKQILRLNANGVSDYRITLANLRWKCPM